ncbi:glycoside hydrolase family 2 protein [Arthrobacter sp. NPDC057013]|uniref:glycoside hydrolase family 2 protein n=1 Tax=Arthrobacter sp. NPDC057013 TaxID=3345999 RepID=UPI00362BE9D0
MNDAITTTPFPTVTSLAGDYPRPQLGRRQWTELAGLWGFAYDDANKGLDGRWHREQSPFDRRIRVPFPPESAASGIGDNSFHPVIWYRRELSVAEVRAAGWGRQGTRMILHFGAVDYRADVWLNGQYLGNHEGGHTPFFFDVTDLLASPGGEGNVLVVRAEDDPVDVAQPRGKQDWQEEPHGIWYRRTTGIWQPVWLEAVPHTSVQHLAWTPDVPNGAVRLSLELNGRPATPVTVEVTLSYEGKTLARVGFDQTDPRSTTMITLPRQSNGQAYESLLWSPENPRLIDAVVRVSAGGGTVDEVSSYFGMRSVGWAGRHFMLNDRPYYLRAVLEQGYWPESHIAAPDGDALRKEVQLIKDFGFNTARIHQKVEDPRFLYWADRLGLLIWGENASAYEFSVTAIERMSREWLEVIRRDASHPSIVTWVPLNESWGVQHISHDQAQLNYAQALYHLTKALDPSRPVVTNDGWEHADSDIWAIHDYGITREELAANYASAGNVEELMAGIGPLGRRMKLVNTPDREQPFIVSEFGGISYVNDTGLESWGYATVSNAEDFVRLLRDLFEALQSSPVLAGFCYTQLTDTLQEANGLADAQRRPKIPVEEIRSIVLGENVNTASHRRPKTPVEQANEPASTVPAVEMKHPEPAIGIG